MPQPPAVITRLADLRRRVDRLEAMRGKVVAGQGINAAELLDALDAAREATLAQVRQAKAEVARLRAGRAA